MMEGVERKPEYPKKIPNGPTDIKSTSVSLFCYTKSRVNKLDSNEVVDQKLKITPQLEEIKC